MAGFLMAGSITVFAQGTASTGVDAYVGLIDAYQVACTGLHLGAYRVETGLRDTSARVDALQDNGPPGLARVVMSRLDSGGGLPPGIARITGQGSGFDDAKVGVCEVYSAPGRVLPHSCGHI
ncbi:hypothetical protein BA898_06240 [Spiribacter roseus]|nr:hypothetical protein BA898_06240 [Spiribacter roseus]